MMSVWLVLFRKHLGWFSQTEGESVGEENVTVITFKFKADKIPKNTNSNGTIVVTNTSMIQTMLMGSSGAKK